MKLFGIYVILMLFCTTVLAQSDSVNEAVVAKWAKHYVTKKSGIGLSIGKGAQQGTIGKYLSGPFVLSVDVDYQRNKILFQLEGGLQFTRAREEMDFNDKFWPKKRIGSGVLLAFNTGYAALDKQQVKIFPYAGAGVSVLSPFGQEENNHDGTGVPVYNMGFYTFLNLFAKKLQIERQRGANPFLRFGIRRQAPIGRPKFPEYLNGSTYYFSIALALL